MAVAPSPPMTTRLLASTLAASLLGGCVTAREQEAKLDAGLVHAYIDDKPPELRRHFFIAQAQGQRNRILNDIVKAVRPVWAELEGSFTTRGGMHSVIAARYGQRRIAHRH